MCCLCIQFTHENTSERTILHLVKKNILGLVACTAKKASYALDCLVKMKGHCLGNWWSVSKQYHDCLSLLEPQSGILIETWVTKCFNTLACVLKSHTPFQPSFSLSKRFFITHQSNHFISEKKGAGISCPIDFFCQQRIQKKCQVGQT